MKPTQESVNRFLAQKPLAVVGVSRTEMKFSHAAFLELKTKGYPVYPVNPNAQTIGDDRCYPDIESIPEKVGGVIVMVPAPEVLDVVKQAERAGVKDVWIQQGLKVPDAVSYCESNGINVVAGQCILMHAEPVGSFHKFHKVLWKLLGLHPKAARTAPRGAA